jgi:hypothetical protein
MHHNEKGKTQIIFTLLLCTRKQNRPHEKEQFMAKRKTLRGARENAACAKANREIWKQGGREKTITKTMRAKGEKGDKILLS